MKFEMGPTLEREQEPEEPKKFFPEKEPQKAETGESIEAITGNILAEAEAIRVRPEDKNEKGQLLIHPGGPISNLPEKQWKIARTKQFKEWFGDWENPPVKSFKTAQGSIYTYDAEGKTTRFKTAESKQHERQDVTVFLNLSPDEERKFLRDIDEAKVYVVEEQPDGNPKIIRDISQVTNPEKIYLASTKEEKWIRKKPASLMPIKGYNTFDTRQFKKNGQTYTERHLSNKVAEVEYDVSGLSKAVDKNREPLILGNEDGTTSFVKIKNPFNTNNEYIKNWQKQNNLEGKSDRFDKFMDYLKSQGYDGLMINGRPARDVATGKYGCDESQILKIK